MNHELKGNMRKVWAIWNYVEAILLMAAGVMAIMFRENDTLQTIVSYVIGGFVILDGLLRFILVLAKYQQSQGSSILLISALEITIGILVILLYQSFIQIAVQFLYLFLMTIGGLFLVYSIYAIVRKYAENLFMPVLEIVFAAIMIGLGVTICVLYNQNAEQFKIAIMITLGVILIMVGIGIFAITTSTLLKTKKKAKQSVVDQPAGKIEEKSEEVRAEPIEPEVVDVEANEKEEAPKEKKKFSLPWSKKKEPKAIEKKPEEEKKEEQTDEPVDQKDE